MNKFNRAHSIFVILFLFISNGIHAQTKKEIALSRRLFVGDWYNKKEKRHISISYIPDGYMNVNEWVGGSMENVDAYRGFIEGDKLVMPAYKSDPIRPYTDMIVRRGVLWYRCKCGLNSSKLTDSVALIKVN